MKRLNFLTLLIVATATSLAGYVRGQSTSFGGGNASSHVDGGYVSDYSPGGTVVLATGSVALANNATYEHGNTLLQTDGNWTSTGSLDLFVAQGANTISGSIAPSFSNAQFNIGTANTMAIINTQGVKVTGNLQFNNGISTTARNTHTISALHFGSAATYTGGNTDAQHVNGYVTKAGGDAFVFPVGSGTDLRTLSISAPATAATIGTAWFAGSPATITDPSDASTHSLASLASSIKAVSPTGFWDWAVTAGSGENIAVTVSMPDVSGFSTAANLRLAGWDGTQWISLSASANATGNTENSTLSGIIPAGITISAIAIGTAEPPLPVTLVSFTARVAETNTLLNWETTEEINAFQFEVQRSGDARNFATIGTVEAVGESKSLATYHFSDQSPLAGINYYRLKQVDKDGTFAFSRTAAVRFEEDLKIKVYPNPATDLVSIESANPLNSVEIFTINGIRLASDGLLQNVASSPVAGFVTQLNVSTYQPGTYLIKVNGRTFKIVKQ